MATNQKSDVALSGEEIAVLRTVPTAFDTTHSTPEQQVAMLKIPFGSLRENIHFWLATIDEVVEGERERVAAEVDRFLEVAEAGGSSMFIEPIRREVQKISDGKPSYPATTTKEQSA